MHFPSTHPSEKFHVSYRSWSLTRSAIFSDPPEKHELGRGRWDLSFCQVSLNYIQLFQRRRKCLSQSEAGADTLFFQMSPKKKQTR